jgi:3-oxoacyl-[acyl-carrier-protein] synthase III
MTVRAVVLATGAYLPARIMTNKDLEQSVETTHEWIVERTGIEQRHIAAEGEFTSHLATKAAQEAIERANIPADSIDLVIVATSTPDETFPSTATKVQHALGISKGAAFDVNAACSGFVYGISIANGYIISGQAKRVLVIGAETFSRIVDWKDRTTCILFGDGAGAMILEARDGKGTNEDRGVLHVGIRSDGQYVPLLNTTGGVSTTQKAGTVFMAGKDIYKHAVLKMPEAVMNSIQALGITIENIDWVAPHQANLRILAGVGQKLGISDSKVISTVQKHANTSAASIPLALHEAVKDGRLKQNQLVACPALGAGLTWGAAIIRW